MKYKFIGTEQDLIDNGFKVVTDYDSDNEVDDIVGYCRNIKSQKKRGLFVPFITVGYLHVDTLDGNNLYIFDNKMNSYEFKKYSDEIVKKLIDKGLVVEV